MPTYLCHGFRWQRRSIVVYVVTQNLDDAAPHWTIKRHSAHSFIESFYNLFDFLPACTLPPSTTASRVGSLSAASPSFVSRQSTDDGNGGYPTPRSSSRSRSRSRSRNRSSAATVVRQQQRRRSQQITFGATPTRDDSSLASSATSTAARRSSTTSSPKRSGPIYQPPRGHHSRSNDPSLQNDAAVDPVLAQSWSPVKLLEEYDPAKTEVSSPHAYVADFVTRVTDSVSIFEEIQRYESRVRHSLRPPVTGSSSDEMLIGKRDSEELGKDAGWLEQLRDELQRSEQIRWYVVVCADDDERAYPAENLVTASRASNISSASFMQHPQYKDLVFQDQDVATRPRNSVVHHQQYKTMVFGEQPQPEGEKREQPTQTFGQGAEDTLMDRRMEGRSKSPSVGTSAPIGMPSLKTMQTVDASVNTSSANTLRSPRTPSKSTFRRLFGRGKAEERTLS